MNAKLLPRIFAFSLACFLLLGILPVFGFSTPTAAAETKVVSFTSPAVPATVGETVTLTDRQKAELDALHDDMMEFVKQAAP